jgi:hypothetical protein
MQFLNLGNIPTLLPHISLLHLDQFFDFERAFLFDAAAGGDSDQDGERSLPASCSLSQWIWPWFPEDLVLHDLIGSPVPASA